MGGNGLEIKEYHKVYSPPTIWELQQPEKHFADKHLRRSDLTLNHNERDYSCPPGLFPSSNSSVVTFTTLTLTEISKMKKLRLGAVK